MARFSLELGVGVKAHITTLPAVPISHLDATESLLQDETTTELSSRNLTSESDAVR